MMCPICGREMYKDNGDYMCLACRHVIAKPEVEK